MKTDKEDYIHKIEANLKVLSAGINELEYRLSITTADVKAGSEIRIHEIKEKRDVLVNKLHELRESSDADWETFKAGVDNAWKDFADAYAAAQEKITKAA
jgi:hypothetical protein